MAHPRMFDDADPLLARVREIALAFPDAAEKVSHGHPAFFTTKVFGYYGGSLRVDGDWEQHERSLLVLVDDAERRALVEDPRCYVPAYLGAYGWVGLDLDGRTDWAEVRELLDASYRLTAGPRRVARLDRRTGTSRSDQPDQRDQPDPGTSRPTFVRRVDGRRRLVHRHADFPPREERRPAAEPADEADEADEPTRLLRERRPSPGRGPAPGRRWEPAPAVRA